MKKQHLWLIIFGLFFVNCITVIAYITKGGSNQGEVVAEVGKEEITRQEWLNAMEERYGKEVLDELIDKKVIEVAGKQYNITVSDDEIERELKMMKSIYASSQGHGFTNEEVLRKEIQTSLLLEELLTKDAIVAEGEIKAYYDEFKDQFHLPDMFHYSKIVVASEDEAKQTRTELEDGASFAVLAMERSIDEFTSSRGGDAGFITVDHELLHPEIRQSLLNQKPGEFSAPIETDEGFTFVLLHEAVEGEEYALADVENMIRRQIAIEQMGTPVSARPFWNEIKVESFYDHVK